MHPSGNATYGLTMTCIYGFYLLLLRRRDGAADEPDTWIRGEEVRVLRLCRAGVDVCATRSLCVVLITHLLGPVDKDGVDWGVLMDG